ncbi:MAG: acyltransferase [Thermodesulfobacteriota bacterium]|nr:acyltransferase [Thermodesulfobacteriota bacterium]
MFTWMPGPQRGVVALGLMAVNTIFWCVPLFLVALFKLLVPVGTWRRWCSGILNQIAVCWIRMNNLNHRLTAKTRWNVHGLDSLNRLECYMVVANHQSWTDILVLQRVFNRRIPLLKFFIKKELIWFPMLGLAWWALDFPFLKRYSKNFIKKHPHLAGKDLETTRRACEKYKNLPVAVMNFVEGTRFTKAKQDRQKAPFDNLLRARAGGLAFALSSMGGRMKRLIDVTIVYPHQGKKSFWNYLCGNIREIKVQVRQLHITEQLQGDYIGDRDFRKGFQNWLNDLWTEKDQLISQLQS